MSKRTFVLVCLLFAVCLLVISNESQAMPNFARKYSADCSMCHIQVPKLNKLGYEFRLAGFRLPSAIGKEEKPFNLGDFFTARFQEQYTWQKHTDVTPSNDFTKSQLEFKEFTFYPLAGSWGKYFASLGEFSIAPDENVEIENAYVRGVYGDDENGWFQARIGIMHAWEGFGASDRPLGNIRPLFQTTKAVGSPFKLWSADQSGVEAGYYFAKTGTNISANIWNGINAAGEAAKGGALTKTSGTPAYNDKDLQLVLNQFISNDASVTLFYYRGVVPFPATGTQTRDTYQRFAAYANYWLVSQKLNLLAGYGYGRDSLKDNTVTGGANVGNSRGYFGEVNYHVIPNKLAFGARYDFFDPSNKVGHNNQTAVTVFGNYYIWHGLLLIADYQHKDTEQPSGGKNKDDQFLARLIFIW